MAKIIRKELEAKLAALNGAEWDSMSEDSMDDEVTPEDIDVVVASNDQAEKETNNTRNPLHQADKKTEKRAGNKFAPCVVPLGPAGQPSGVIYIGHIPHGFYEEAMNGFFKQFGEVVRLRISRSKKSTRCKGYAFVEFSSPEVASIAAETMDGYLLFGKQLKSSVLKYDEIHPNIFQGAGSKLKRVNWHSLYRESFNVNRTPEKDKKIVKKLLARDKARRKKFAALGIDYDFPGFAASLKDRKVAEGPFQDIKTPKTNGKAASESKKRKGENIVAPAGPAKTTSSSEKSTNSSSVSKKLRTQAGIEPVIGAADGAKDASPVSVTKTKTAPKAAKKRTGKVPSPPEATHVESKASKVSAAVGAKVARRKLAQGPASAADVKAKEMCATTDDSGEGKELNKTRKSARTKTPRKVISVASSDVQENPIPGESRAVGRNKGSPRKSSSTKRKASKILANADPSETADIVRGTATTSSNVKTAKSPKGSKPLAQEGRVKASKATSSTGKNPVKRNKRSKP